MTGEALDPLTATVFVAIFAACVLLTKHRPAFGAAALVLADPFALSRDVFATTVTIPKVALLGVLVGLCAYAGNWARLRTYPAPYLIAAFVLYFLGTLASVPGAEYVAPALRETLKSVQYLGFFVAAYLCLRADEDGDAAVTAVAIATLAVAGSALVQEIAGAPSALCIGPQIVPRIAGFLEGPNQLSAYLEIAMAILGAWAISRPSALLSAALAFAACPGVLTFSRAGFGGAIVVFAVLIFVWRRRALTQLWGAWVGLAAGISAAAWLALARGVDVLRISLDESLCAGGVGHREQLWPAAWRMWLAHPLLGVGAGNFELELPLYGVYGIRTHANSWYLQSLAEGGVALFAATVTLVVTALGIFVRALREGSPWVLAAFAATLALALHQIVDYVVFYPQIGDAWCILLGFGAAAVAWKRTA